MTIYNQQIKLIRDILPDNGKIFPYTHTRLKKADKNNIIFSKDSAFELGGSQLACVSTMAVTSSEHFDNSTVLYGSDLYEIKCDSPFAKIVLLEIDDIDEDSAFDRIKELELVRYNYCPEGFMTRASALNMREQIRVSKKALKNKVSFEDFGNALIGEYLKNPVVKSVQIIFITEFEKFDELGDIAAKIKATTSALNHILDNVIFDCSSCNLKEICDEVDGMKELHMKKTKSF